MQSEGLFECPSCGYKMSKATIDKATEDYHCPRCVQVRISEFKGVTLTGGNSQK